MATPEHTRVRVTDPSEILSVVPLLIGFEPSPGDVVTLGLGKAGKVLVTARVQASDVGRDLGGMRTMFDGFRANGVESVFVAGYGSGEAVTPAVDRILSVAGQDLAVMDAVRVEDNRIWSYTCTELECCPAEGREFVHDSQASTTLRAEAGLDAAPSRDALAARIAPVELTEEATQAWTRAKAQPPTLDEGRALVLQALGAAQEGRQLSDDDVARLGVAMHALPVRDDAWSRMQPELAEQHQQLWTDVVRRSPEAAVAPTASMLAFTSWQRGDGAMANLAVDRALEAQPDYSMAGLVQGALDACLPPSAAVLPMTPEEVAASYAEPVVDLELGA